MSCSAPAVVLPTPTPTREPGVLNVAVLLDLSGPRSPSGQAQRNAMQLWIDQTPATGVKTRVTFVDVAGSDARVLLELRRAVVDDRADAAIIGTPLTLDGALADAIRVAAVPVLLTLPVAEPAGVPGGRFIFALAPSPAQIARAIAGDIVDRSLAQPMLLAGDATRAAAVERTAFLAELRGRGLTPPQVLALDTADGAQRARAATAVAKSVVLFGASAPYGDLVRSIPVAAGAPVVYLSYLTETADVTNLREASALVAWPGANTMAFAQTATAGPSTAAQFLQRFVDRYGRPSTLAATAYDALDLIGSAASSAPSDLDASRLRDRLEATTFGGVVARYSFAPSRHLGFASEYLALLRWSAQRGAPIVLPRPETVQ